MREHATTPIRSLIVALSTIENQLRALRSHADADERLALVRRKQAIVQELRRRKPRRRPTTSFVA
jgi:hypothetical protein